MENAEIKIYTAEDGKTTVEVRLEKDTVWLNQNQLAQLFQTERSVINKHILNIYKTGELDEKATCAKIAQVQSEGHRKVERKIIHYNLDVIIAVGYRVNSRRGTQFRIWANQVLKDYLIQGYVLNLNRLQKQNEQLNELKKILNLIQNISQQKKLNDNEYEGLISIVTNYAHALDMLDQYDYQTLNIENITYNNIYQISYRRQLRKFNLLKRNMDIRRFLGKKKTIRFAVQSKPFTRLLMVPTFTQVLKKKLLICSILL